MNKYHVTIKVKDMETQLESEMTFNLNPDDLVGLVIPLGDFIRGTLLFPQISTGRVA
jgi:hypothetical protein